MTIDVRNLAAFKRFLALPGATVQVVRHDWLDNPAPNSGWADPARRAATLAPRTVVKLQTNAVKFSNDSWLYFDTAHGGRGAAGFRFEGQTVTLDLGKDGSFGQVCVYRLSVAATAGAVA